MHILFQGNEAKSTDIKLVLKHLRMCKAHGAVVPFQVGAK